MKTSKIRFITALFCIMLATNIHSQATTDTKINTAINVLNDIGKAFDDAADAIAATNKPRPTTTNIQLYNNTDEDVSIAIAKYDYANKCWVSEGWWIIKAYESFTHNIGRYAGKIYVHAEQSGLFGDTWAGDYKFCTDRDGFSIRYADQVDCSLLNKKGFFEWAVTAGENTNTLNP